MASDRQIDMPCRVNLGIEFMGYGKEEEEAKREGGARERRRLQPPFQKNDPKRERVQAGESRRSTCLGRSGVGGQGLSLKETGYPNQKIIIVVTETLEI